MYVKIEVTRRLDSWRALFCLVILFAVAVASGTLTSAMGIDDDGPALQARIEGAAGEHARRVVIAPGVYRLRGGHGRSCLLFEGLENLEIDASGVTLLRRDPTKAALEFLRCRNVVLHGLSLVNETPPFTQGTLIAIDARGIWFDLRLDADYPEFDKPGRFLDQPTGYVFSRGTRHRKPGTRDYRFDDYERTGEHVFRLSFSQPMDPAAHPVEVGDRMAFPGRVVADIRIARCAGMVVRNVRILSGSGLCIHESGGDGGNRYSYTVTYGHKPRGADVDPLIACNADAFYSCNVRQGPMLDECRFESIEGNPDHRSGLPGGIRVIADSEPEKAGANDRARMRDFPLTKPEASARD